MDDGKFIKILKSLLDVEDIDIVKYAIGSIIEELEDQQNKEGDEEYSGS